MGDRRDRSAESFLIGIICTVLFGVLWINNGRWIWVFPLLFAGILPVMRGLRGLIARIGRKKPKKLTLAEQQAFEERQVLRLAENTGGKLTPAIVALRTNLTTQKAEEILQKFVKNNHASMEITSDGIVEYEFPEFRRNIENSS